MFLLIRQIIFGFIGLELKIRIFFLKFQIEEFFILYWCVFFLRSRSGKRTKCFFFLITNCRSVWKSKMSHLSFSIFFINSPNWPFSAFLMNFCLSKCKRSSLRLQCWMRLFWWFSSTVENWECRLKTQNNNHSLFIIDFFEFSNGLWQLFYQISTVAIQFSIVKK